MLSVQDVVCAQGVEEGVGVDVARHAKSFKTSALDHCPPACDLVDGAPGPLRCVCVWGWATALPLVMTICAFPEACKKERTSNGGGC